MSGEVQRAGRWVKWDACANCDALPRDHVDGKCLFQETYYKLDPKMAPKGICPACQGSGYAISTAYTRVDCPTCHGSIPRGPREAARHEEDTDEG
jgi:hypothetical protein